ncbi:MAG: trypsin-like peptidase domain-containing protein [Planctomycetota bacterium]
MRRERDSNIEIERRLRETLARFSPGDSLEDLKPTLATDSSESPPTGEVLESLSATDSVADEAFATESLDVLINDPDDGVLSPDQLFGLEAIVHKRFRPAVFVQENSFRSMPDPWTHLGNGPNRKVIENAIPAIGRVELPDHPSLPYGGTGFLVGENLVMTNRHVAEIFCRGVGRQQLKFVPGQRAQIDFLEEQFRSDELVVDVDRVLMIHPFWDMALLSVRGIPKGIEPLTLSSAKPEELHDEDVVVIGYPAMDRRNDIHLQNQIFGGVFDVKRIQPGKLLSREEVSSFGNPVRAITHDCSTLGGNSGSAVLHVPSGQIVGLHFAGIYLKANYAVPSYDLASDGIVVQSGVRIGKGDVPVNDVYPPLWRAADQATERSSRALQPTSPDSTPSHQRTSPPTVVNNELKFEWIQPLEFSVRLGNPARDTGHDIHAFSRTNPSDAASPREGRLRSQPLSDDVLAGEFNLESLVSPSFNWTTTYAMALASQLAYESPSTIKRITKHRWQFDDCEFIESGETQAFLASTGDVNLVSFRGTAAPGDWITDLRILGSARPYGTVHNGFLQAFRLVEPQLIDLLDSRPNRLNVLTGHSLGGALAVIAAAEWHHGPDVTSLHTFGQPGVGKGRFAPFMRIAYGNRHVRVVNDDDIVPRVPPTYEHTGKLVHLGRGEIHESLNSSTEDESHTSPPNENLTMTESQFAALQEQLQPSRQPRADGHRSLEITNSARHSEPEGTHTEGFLPSFRDHSISRYIGRLAEQIPLEPQT